MMFGHQDDKHDKKHGDGDDAATTVAPDQPADMSADVPADDTQDQGAADSGQQDSQSVDDDQAWQHPGEPADGQDDSAPAQAETDHHDEAARDEDQPAEDENPGPIRDIIAPAGSGNAQNPVPPMPLNARDVSDDDARTPHELIDIKQKALGELTPLMSQLDLSPEDKFRTLLMIIQASDNQDMIKQAYAAAEDIKDEKVRAQALLDLVNEINYFTQHPQG